MHLPQEPFTSGSSLLHRADPRGKLVAAVALALAIAVGRSLPAAGVGVVLGALLAFAARLPLRPVFWRLGAANLFVAFLWLVTPFTAPGEPVLTFGPLQASREGVALAMLVTLKCNAIVLCLLALVATTPLPAVGHALQRLHLPASLCWLLLFTYRYIFTIGQEYMRLSRAARLRGFTPKNSMHTYRTYANLLGMTLVKSWNRGQRVQQAMELRGFNGSFHCLEHPRMQTQDMLLAGALLLAAAGLLSLAFVGPQV